MSIRLHSFVCIASPIAVPSFNTLFGLHGVLILCSPNVHCCCCKQKKGSAACAGRGLIVLQVCVLFMCGCGKPSSMSVSNLVFHTPCTLVCRGISRKTCQKKERDVTQCGGLLQAKPAYTFLHYCVSVCVRLYGC